MIIHQLALVVETGSARNNCIINNSVNHSVKNKEIKTKNTKTQDSYRPVHPIGKRYYLLLEALVDFKNIKTNRKMNR